MPKKCTAIKALLWLVLLCPVLAWAGAVAGTVTQLSGPMMAKKPDGKVKILALKSEVESGDTLVTERNTYALVKFIDNSEITLKPGTTFVVERFAYQANDPGQDQASFSLLKGGLRSLSGLLGKRSKEKFALKTPVATIGIRGTYFIANYVAPADAAAPGAPAQAPGLYVAVTDGMILVSNAGGQHTFGAGQFGFVATPDVSPILVPANPGAGFTPPPAFSSITAAAGVSATPAPGAVDCIVR